ncbi:MAG: hypothetical protein D6808_00765 [Candidatus Dadabacteria bacterium]|nr:MAG: hypothetical protein D6808_00765 [Candidatus Dadabacteria bacterium]
MEEIRNQIAQFKVNKIGIVSDDCSSTGKGVVFAPAQDITEEALNRIITVAGGLSMVALGVERASELGLRSMSFAGRNFPLNPNTDTHGYCVSVEAREGVATGISVRDRVCTVRILGEPKPDRKKLVSPGHIFPVTSKEGGVLMRTSVKEGALDIVKIAGFTDAAFFVELLDGEGNYLPLDQHRAVAQQNGFVHFFLSDLIRYRLATEKFVVKVAEATLPTYIGGEFKSFIYHSKLHEGEHLALVKGDITNGDPVLTRVQREHTLNDVFGRGPTSTRGVVHYALREIGEEGRGVFVYLRRPETGFLKEEVLLGRKGASSTPSTMLRQYGIGAQILHDLGVRKVELITSSSSKLIGINTFGIEIVKIRPLRASIGERR